ncbi:amidase [Qingshengfaniella alkalisoli]|uniref:Amidase n=2 Tax=Qingshengfaniella alkalisoli TaxID=2599296 RepID=A0A5B8IAC1_9RHOB|nr:amidase [Qingshengfaniella alkalisoli]
MTAAGLGRGIGAGKIDPVELTECFLSALDDSSETPRIYARTTPGTARAEAEVALKRAKDGNRQSALDGVPVSWKDLFDTAGVATEAGSALLKGRVPEADAPIVAAGRMAGLVSLGKTHLTELAFSGLGYNPMTASPPCVNDPDAVSGGSSSGAATSVAFGLAAAAMGSDTGGSVRVPAAWNDLVGLKTTHGRMSLKGAVPLAEKFDTPGPLTRSVEDAALMLSVLEGRKPTDLAGASLDGKTLAVLDTIALDGLASGVSDGFEQSLKAFERAGAKITRFSSAEVEEAMGLAGVLYTTEAYAIWGETIEAAPEKMFPPVRERFRAGASFSGVDYVRAWRRLEVLRAGFTAATAGFDAVMIPSVAILPPKIADLADDDYFTQTNLMALRNTRIGNLMGSCALTLPTGIPSVGVSLVGAPMTEERLLRLGVAAEAALT